MRNHFTTVIMQKHNSCKSCALLESFKISQQKVYNQTGTSEIRTLTRQTLKN